MLKTIFYRVIYYPPINRIIRNVNRLIAPILPGIMTPVSGVIGFRLRSGKKVFLRTNQTDYVAKLIFYHGVYKYEYVDLFEKLIQKCKGFIDVGSNAGVYSLIAGVEQATEIRVIALDPSTAASFFVPYNIKLNNLDGIVTFCNSAASNVSGELIFYEVSNKKYPFEKYNLGGASSLVIPPEEFVENRVSVYRLDDIIEKEHFGTQQIDLVKIDAEGAEPLILQGMERIIEKWKPIIICEILFDSIESELDIQIRKYEYRVFFHDDNHLVEVSAVSREKDDNVRNCFLVPDEKLHWIDQFVKK